MDEAKDDIQGLLLGDFFEGFLWDLALSLEGRNWGVKKPVPKFHSQAISLHFLGLPKGSGTFIFNLLDSQTSPWTYRRLDQLWCSSIHCPEDTCVGEEQVLSISATIQTHWHCNATTKSMPLSCWDTWTSVNTMCNDEERPVKTKSSVTSIHAHWSLKQKNRVVQKNREFNIYWSRYSRKWQMKNYKVLVSNCLLLRYNHTSF